MTTFQNKKYELNPKFEIFKNNIISDSQFELEKKETGYFLLNQTPNIYKIFPENKNPTELEHHYLPLDKERYLIYGKCQSGKTNWIISAITSHIYFSKNISIIILRNSIGDAKQLQTRCNEFINNYKIWMGNNNINSKNIFNYIYIGSCNNKSKLKFLEKIFKTDTPYLIIVIANETQLNKLISIINPIENPKFIIAIDEADQIAYGNSNASFRQKLLPILEKAGRAYCVTATSFDILFTDEEIKSSNIVILDTPENYKGLDQINLKHLINDKVTPATNTKKWFNNDINIIPVLIHLSNTERSENQPIITLIKATHFNNLQLSLLKKISEIDELKCWNGIVYNSKGIYIFSHNSTLTNKIGNKIGEPVLYENKQTEEYSLFHNCLFFSKTQINEGIQYFYDLNEQSHNKITHIAIIAGDLADRCISFVSQNYKWHLTHMYYIPSKKTKTPDIIQSIGRLCGNFNDNLPLYLFSPKQVLEDFVKGLKLQQEIIERARIQEQKQELDSFERTKVITIVKNMVISSSKIPKRILGVQENTKFNKEQIVKGEDNGTKIQEYSEQLNKIELGEYKIINHTNINTPTTTTDNIIETEIVDQVDNNLILIDISKLSENEKRTYDTVYEIYNKKYSNVWINRSIIANEIIDMKTFGNQKQVYAKFQTLINKSNKISSLCEPGFFGTNTITTPGIYMQKDENDRWKIIIKKA